MNDQSETERGSIADQWFGLDRLRLSEGDRAIDVTIGSADRWDRSHLRRLRQSGDLPGMVPIIDSDFSADGKPFAVTPVIGAPTLESLLDAGDLNWTNGAGIAEATARAVHEAHLRGLFHGAISPGDVHVIGNDVALAGVGLGLGGTIPPDREHWTAPEVRDGDDPTERSDVYSLGKLLEASLGSSIDTAPRSVRRLIMWSSSDTPEARPPSAMEFASILAEGLGEERKSYGPAFISTSDVSELAGRASSAVTRHEPSPRSATGSDDIDLSGAAVTAGVAAAGAAAVGGAAALLNDADDADPTIIDEGFLVAEPAEGEADLDTAYDGPADDGAEVFAAAGPVEEPVSMAEVAATTAEVYEPIEAAPVMAAQTADTFGLPPMAHTVDLDETYIPPRQRSRAGLVVGGLLALGMAAIAWGALQARDDNETAVGDAIAPVTTEAPDTNDEGDTATTTADGANTGAGGTAEAGTATSTGTETGTAEEGAATTATTTATTAATTATTTATTAATTATTTATTAATTATTTATTQAPAGPVAALLGPGEPIAAGDAAVQVLHGVPGAAVDVYVNGEAIATNFTTGAIAGPIELAPGDYDIALFATQGSSAPASAEDRSDDPLVEGTVPVGSQPASLVAHLNDKGELALSAFAEKLTALAPGQSRLVLRHLMNSGPVDVSVNGRIVGTLQPGTETSLEVEAGTVAIEFVGDDGAIAARTSVTVSDGQLASLSAIGAPGTDTAEIVIQRYSGLSTAPTGVPTGDSGLLWADDSTGLRLVYGLMILLAISGGIVAFRRQRSWS